MDIDQLTSERKKYTNKLMIIRKFLDIDKKKEVLAELNQRIENDPNFWNDPHRSAEILQKKKNLSTVIEEYKCNQQNIDDVAAAIELAKEDSEFLGEASCLLEKLSNNIKSLEAKSLLNDQLDKNNAVMTINAGAGGTESCDWASMLLRMYLRFSERQGWSTEIYDILPGEEAGIKNITFSIIGENVFGLLKAEIGVHRLVRISPFDSNSRRHTSFASICLSPVVDDHIEVVINESDLRIDTYRASGAGGQHINKTDSAVRITHLPTKTVVQCQTQRSQHQNRDQAMKLLKGKLYEIELKKKQEDEEKLQNEKRTISFGHQIRSYILHPYKMVKDHRTNLESSDPDNVLDGALLNFITHYLITLQENNSSNI